MALHAQPNITRIEYFIDTDPGFGNGTSIPFTPSSNVNLNSTLDLSTVPNGFHFIYLRGKDANARWSVASYRMLYKGMITSTAPTQVNVTKVEYFFDNDPGLGKGIPVSITPGFSVNVNQTFDVSSLSDGFHWIYIRGMDANKKWSVASYRMFFKGVITSTAPTQVNVTKVEYFFDNDPGLGKGTPVTITPGNSVNVNHTFDCSSLGDGFHWIYIRGMDANKKWSVASYRQFYKGTITSTPPTQSNIVKVEYFINTDPGFGKGTTISITPGTSVNINTTINVSSLPDGFHRFYIRGMDATGKWDCVSWRYFYKGPPIPVPPGPSTIRRVEYFIDTDPGLGLGTALSFTPNAVEDSISTVIDIGALSEGPHKFCIRIKDALGRWSYLNQRRFVLDKTPPGAPANLSIVIGNSQATLSWNQNSEADFLRYRIYKGTQSGNEVRYDSIAGKASNTKIVTGLTNDVNYFFYISAVDSAMLESSPSNTVSGTPLATAGPPPVPVIASPSELNQFSFRANWNPSPSATKYYLDVSTNINFTSFVTGFNNKDAGDVIFCDVTGLAKNTTYYYRVRAWCAYGISLNSGTMSATTLLDPPAQPSAPVVIPATILSLTGFTANWNPSATSTGYRIDVAKDDGFTQFVTGYNDKDVGNVLNTTVTGLTKNTDYYYRVRAYNQYGTSSNSNSILVTTWPEPPSAANSLDATNISQTFFTANWNAVSTATGYRIDVATDVGFTSFISGFNNKDVSNTTNFIVTGLTENVTYYYRIRAYNKGGTGLSSSPVIVTTLRYPPEAPIALQGSNISHTHFTANWNSVPAAAGYLIDVATDMGFTIIVTGLNNKDVNNVTNFTVTGLEENVTYYYRIRGYNNGGAGLNSNIISVTTLITLPSPPDSPLALQPTDLSHTYFTANWKSVSTAAGYRLDVATDNSFTTFVSGFNNKDVSNTTNFIVTGLTNNVTYYYRVRAYNIGGTGLNSNTIQVTTPVELPPPPDPPLVGSPGNITQTAFVANWSPSTIATSYKIDVAKDIGFTSIVSGYNNKDVGNVISLSVTGLNANTTYFYRVRASNAGGTSNNSGVVSVTTKPYPPATPTGVSVLSCEYLVTLKWKGNDEADFLRYRIYGGISANPTTKIDSTTSGRSDTLRIYSGLIKGQTYFYRIKAVSLNGLESDYSSQVSIKVIKGVTPKVHAKWNDVLICYNLGDSLASYQWYQGTSALSGATGQYYVTKKQPGSYSVISIDKNGCRDTSNIISLSGAKSIQVYPNPASTNVILSLKSETTGATIIRIFSDAGYKIAEYKAEKNEYYLEEEIRLENIHEGIYTIEAIVNNQEVNYSKLVIIK